MKIGIDFDNTIVRYDRAIAKISERLDDIPKDMKRNKKELRDFLRQSGREQEWTEFQGMLYGPGMEYAEPYSHAVSVMHELEANGHDIMILSHRSRAPYAGPRFDLRKWARDWIVKELGDLKAFGQDQMNGNALFFESKSEKITAIAEYGCRVFIDDLTSVLNDESFPRDCFRVLFAPNGNRETSSAIRSICCWPELLEVVDEISQHDHT